MPVMKMGNVNFPVVLSRRQNGLMPITTIFPFGNDDRAPMIESHGKSPL
jgi:hypothetical protein